MRAKKIRALGVFGRGTEVEVEGKGRRIGEEGLCEAGWVRGSCRESRAAGTYGSVGASC